MEEKYINIIENIILIVLMGEIEVADIFKKCFLLNYSNRLGFLVAQVVKMIHYTMLTNLV